MARGGEANMIPEKWELPDFEVIDVAFEVSMYVYTK
ncbi:MAG: pyrroloquinoline quinone precursor peptide PqqA [Candidatus Dormibacteraeota bacterium]|nr:pyrroloquinoline quinone precursor peptide PqqA [Candidatus Dormibacteraeota bacterium]